MPRIRTIKPEFWSSPSTAGADPWVRLLYIAMWNWADDSGRGTANVKELAAFAFPHDDDPGAPTAAELPSLLTEVRGRFGVIFYEVDGRRYYAIPTWEKHQRNERRAKSRHPAPEDGTEYNPTPPDQGKPGNCSAVAEVPTHSRGSSDTTRGSSGTGTGEQGNRGTGEIPSAVDHVTPDRASARDRAAALSGKGHSPAAAKIVNAYAATCRKRPPAAVRNDLAVQVDDLLTEDWTAEEIHEALLAWGAKGLDARKLPSVANEIANRAPDRGRLPPALAARPSTTDQRVAAAQALKARLATDGATVLQLPTGGTP